MENELDMMRQQLTLLQNRLDKEVTLREESLRKLLHRGAHSFRNRELASIALVVFAILFIPYSMYTQHCSTPLVIVTAIFFVGALIFEIIMYRKLHVGNILDQDLLSAQKDLHKYRDLNKKYLYRAGIPFILVWGSWYAADRIGMLQPDIVDRSASYHWGFAIGIVAAMLVGGTIGGLIGYYGFYRPQMQLAKDMATQISELTNDEPAE